MKKKYAFYFVSVGAALFRIGMENVLLKCFSQFESSQPHQLID